MGIQIGTVHARRSNPSSNYSIERKFELFDRIIMAGFGGYGFPYSGLNFQCSYMDK